MNDAHERETAAHGYEHTPGVEKGTEGTVLAPRMDGDPVTPEDINPGPTARGSRANAGPAASADAPADAATGGDRPFDPGIAYTGQDVDPTGAGGVGGIVGGIGAPARDAPHRPVGSLAESLADGPAGSPGGGSAGGIGGSTIGASQMQTVAGGAAIPGAEADVRADAGGRFGGHAGAAGDPAASTSGSNLGNTSGIGTDDRDISASAGGHGGLGAGIDQGANVDAPNPFFGTSGMAPHDAGDAAGG